MSESYYHILGVPSDADEREIKRAYHRLARELHPDKAASPQQAREAEQRFAVISKAYNVLKDPSLRKDYDGRKSGPRGGNGAEASRPKTPTQSVMRSTPKPVPASAGDSGASENKTTTETVIPAREVRSSKNEAGLNAQRATIAQKAFAKGVQLVKQKDYLRAIEFFEAAISNNPNEAPYHAYLSMALVNAKRSASKAIESAERAIELDTYNIDYKMNLAQIYGMIGSKSHAIKVYEEIIRWDEKNPVALQMLREMKKKDGFFYKLVDESPILSRIQGMLKRK
jgi:curved DNA-binding protein CbpA